MGNGVVSIPTPKTKGRHLFNKLMTTVSDINSPEFLKMKINVLQEDLVHVKEELMTKEHEVQELQREVNKLKTVLLQSNNYNTHSSCDTITPFHEIRSEDFTTLAQKRKILQKSYSIATANKKIGVSSESSEFLGQNCNVKITRYEKDFRSKQIIKEAIQQNDFLAKLDASQVREVVDSMHPMEFQEGSYVIKEGNEGDHLYVAADGEYDVIKDGVSIGRIGPGEVFGEMAILYNCTRTASVKAMMDCSVWVLERRIFQHIMVKTGLQRLHDNITFLKSIQLLHSLPNDILAKIADVFKIEFYYGGDYVVKHGIPGDTFFLINTGRVKVLRRSSITKEECELKILNKGAYFGEQANMKEDFKSLSIIAMSPGVECVTLDKESFNNLIGDVEELHERSYALENKMSSGNLSQISDDSVYKDIELNDLRTIATLGVGGFGRVELVQNSKNSSMTFALKCLKKQHVVSTRQEEHVLNEKAILMSIKHPFICRLFRTYRDNKYVYLLMEALLGGEVWTIMHRWKCYNDYTARFITGCVLEALQYLHTRGIIYRDLKPENLLLDQTGYVKLVDFGFAKRLLNGTKTWTFCGTPEYVAPEIILNKGHDRAVDYWAVGILIHELLTGRPPFMAKDPMKVYNLILKGINSIHFSKRISAPGRGLIKRLCREAPTERIGYQKGGFDEIRNHKWYEGFSWNDLRNKIMTPPISPIVNSAHDYSNFECYEDDSEEPPDELSGWDEGF